MNNNELFKPNFVSGKISTADDSSIASVEIAGANAIQIYNSDDTYPIIVSIGFSDAATFAEVPTSATNGVGVVIKPGDVQTFGIPGASYTSTMWVSVACEDALNPHVIYYNLGTV